MKRKRVGLFILSLLLLLTMTACGEKTETVVYDGEYASQEAFMADMAKGISDRLKNVDDSIERTGEEDSAYKIKVVNCELKQIAKYQDSRFEDETFNELAHFYIDACQMQLFSAENYKNSNLYPGLWNAGRSARCAVIAELYSRYGLPITAEEAASYSDSSELTITIGPSQEAETDYSDCLTIKELPEWNTGYSYHHDLTVTNKKAECSLDISISAVFYDSKGNVVGTSTGYVDALGKGETQLCQLDTDVPFARAEYSVGSAAESFSLSAMEDLDFKVTTPGEKIMVAVKNTGTEEVEYGKVLCVFYNGRNIVDVDFDAPVPNSDPLKPGETQYAELSTYETYTKYELYYAFEKEK